MTEPNRPPAPDPSPAANRDAAPILGFDPGRDKCGLAVVRPSGEVLARAVVPAEGAIARLRSYAQQFGATVWVMGDRTTAKTWRAAIAAAAPELPPPVPVDEHNSTLEARDRYWQANPPRGLARWIPQGMREPPEPLDDWVAVLLVERYLRDAAGDSPAETLHDSPPDTLGERRSGG